MKKIVSLLLCLIMLLCLFPTGVVSAADEAVYVLAGSDFQVKDSGIGQGQVKAITRRMYHDGFAKFDGLLFCGDYTPEMDNKTSDSQEGYDALMNVLDPLIGDHRVFVKGNHDPKETKFLTPSGANDAKAYGTFVINESDFCWPSSVYKPADRQKRTKAIAAELEVYLKEKIDRGYNKPVFVVSHVPLHYTYRTKTAGDSDQANFIFDVLNEAGKKLNIFFLFGHNHSNGWDDYLGGGAIYLKKGDSINIAQASMTEFKEETLNFTYMNAGYTGYYNNHNDAYGELTMTLFRIIGNEVLVARYSMRGRADLKAKGVRNAYKGEEGYAVDTTVYKSPRLVTLGGDVETVMPTTTKKTTTTTAASTTTKKTTTTKSTTIKATTTKATTTKSAVAVVTTTVSKATTTQAGAVDTTSTTMRTTTVGSATTTELQAVATTVLPDTDGSTEVLTTTTTTADAVITTPSTTLPSQSTGSEPESSPVLIIVIAAAAVLVAGTVVVIALVRKKKTNE